MELATHLGMWEFGRAWDQKLLETKIRQMKSNRSMGCSHWKKLGSFDELTKSSPRSKSERWVVVQTGLAYHCWRICPDPSFQLWSKHPFPPPAPCSWRLLSDVRAIRVQRCPMQALCLYGWDLASNGYRHHYEVRLSTVKALLKDSKVECCGIK